MNERAMRDLIKTAQRAGLCCVHLLAWIRSQGYDAPAITALTTAQMKAITAKLRERFDV